MLCRDYKDKEADRMVTRIDPGVAALVAKLRGHERQAARGTGAVEDRRAAITLAMLMTTAELEGPGEEGAGDGEIAGGGRPGGSNVASPQPAARAKKPACGLRSASSKGHNISDQEIKPCSLFVTDLSPSRDAPGSWPLN